MFKITFLFILIQILPHDSTGLPTQNTTTFSSEDTSVPKPNTTLTTEKDFIFKPDEHEHDGPTEIEAGDAVSPLIWVVVGVAGGVCILLTSFAGFASLVTDKHDANDEDDEDDEFQVYMDDLQHGPRQHFSANHRADGVHTISAISEGASSSVVAPQKIVRSVTFGQRGMDDSISTFDPDVITEPSTSGRETISTSVADPQAPTESFISALDEFFR